MRGRRALTWLLVAGLAAIGLAAAVDAVRDEPEVRRTEAVTATAVPDLAGASGEVADRLRAVGVSGILTYSDEDCRLHAVSLPELEPVRAPSFEMCRPATSTGELGAVDGEVVWSGLGYGAVQVVLSRKELSRAIRPWLGIPAAAGAGFRAVQVASLDEDRYAVLADSTYDPQERVLALFAGKRVLLVQPRWVIRDARFLRPSPSGGYFGAFGPAGLLWFDRNGDPRAFPAAVHNPQSVAWSPDDRWTALATAESVYIFESARPEDGVVRIPLAVRDLDWSESGLAGSP